ncbi:uncharacterized protein PV09_02623 [Verruconis gallopava]|uniref:Major facilitator superfamily (MFS) profile domain-containing protein n=1 Tax=Verruconis gallopava TaxID=253628 RepID=A0A0D2B6X4_9PEZI|nr:uncharacterized protein PV09_02623 [Verruconis gallopava]KIW06964.1 hypothetical protein PV09_02623 [Verruconis gallopava]
MSTSPPRPTNKPAICVEESIEARLNRLGRQRPSKFKSAWSELGFCYSVAMSQALTEYFVSGFNVVLPTIAKDLNIPPATQTWPANAFSLVIACFLLVFGRVADMYGGYVVYVGGVSWLTIWALIAGFAQNEIMIDLARAIGGLGPAAYLPSSLMLLGSIYRPGPRKNIIFSVYGACAPLGFFVGIFFAGVTAQYTTWRWYFFIGAIISAATAAISFWAIPSDWSVRKNMDVKMDWWGAVLISAGLILIVFAITDSADAPKGWSTPYIYATMIAGILCLIVALYVEGWVAEQPLLPFDLFCVKYMKPLCIALIFQYGVLGNYLLYATFYMTDVMGGTPMQLVVWYTPLAAGGCIIATVGGFFLHKIPGTVLILIAGASYVVSALLFAIIPVDANYWAYIFTSCLCCTIGIDITFSVTNIFITTSMPLKRQGLAGALINSLLQLGIALFLGFGALISKETEDQGVRQSYKNVFWFAAACGGVALLIMAAFVRLREAKSDYTADELATMEDSH